MGVRKMSALSNLQNWNMLLRQTHGSCCFYFIFEKLLCAELEDIVQFLFGHGSSFGAQAGPHHQVGQHHLPLRHLSDPLLHRAARHKAIDHHLPVLAYTMSPAESLGEWKRTYKR